MGLGTFYKCNARCVYCVESNAQSYRHVIDISRVFDKLLAEKLVDAGTEVMLANGEPTLYEYFDEILLKVFHSNAKIHVRTNGLLFSNSLYNYLYSDKNSINISVDAGTKETYQKIKRINGFDRVWKNIKKYRETNGDVQVKYVVFSYNSNPKELEAFVEKCLEANIRHVVVSAELNALHNHPNCPWEFGEREYIRPFSI